jgi:hypothetical protein
METNPNAIEGGEIMSTDLSRREERQRLTVELSHALIDLGFSDPEIIADLVMITLISIGSGRPYCPLCHHDADNVAAHLREAHSA